MVVRWFSVALVTLSACGGGGGPPVEHVALSGGGDSRVITFDEGGPVGSIALPAVVASVAPGAGAVAMTTTDSHVQVAPLTATSTGTLTDVPVTLDGGVLTDVRWTSSSTLIYVIAHGAATKGVKVTVEDGKPGSQAAPIDIVVDDGITDATITAASKDKRYRAFVMNRTHLMVARPSTAPDAAATELATVAAGDTIGLVTFTPDSAFLVYMTDHGTHLWAADVQGDTAATPVSVGEQLPLIYRLSVVSTD